MIQELKSPREQELKDFKKWLCDYREKRLLPKLDDVSMEQCFDILEMFHRKWMHNEANK